MLAPCLNTFACSTPICPSGLGLGSGVRGMVLTWLQPPDQQCCGNMAGLPISPYSAGDGAWDKDGDTDVWAIEFIS